MPNSHSRSILNRPLTAALIAPLLASAFFTLPGCDNAGQGAVSGAGIGALSGLAIGSLSGNAGKGAVIGAVAGGVGGAVLGDQNRRSNERAQQQHAAIPPASSASTSGPSPSGPPTTVSVTTPASLTQSDRDRLALSKLARNWRVTGWETVDGQRRLVSGTASGSVENAFFIRLIMTITDEQTRQVNNGNIVFASEPGRGLTMNSHFDTSPFPITYSGTVSNDGNLFTLDEIAPSAGARRIVARFISPTEWVADVSDRSGSQSTPQASFNFNAN